MKYSAIVITATVSSANAFSTLYTNYASSTTTQISSSATPAAVEINKPIYDPLGMYSKDAPERLAGLIQPIESLSSEDTTKVVLDPLGLYGGAYSKEQQSVETSASLPFLERPEYLDGTLAGDRGFDPFGFASGSPENLLKLRNSELKHARLAMLAAVGWPLAELFHKDLAEAWNLPEALNLNDRVPSVLNGGLGNVSPVFWIGALALAAIIETSSGAVGQVQSPNLGFDPFQISKLAGKDERFLRSLRTSKMDKDERFLEDSELFNGRLAMLAITGFAIQEWFTGNSVVDAIPIFFKPFNVVMEQLLNTGAAQSI